jgi:RecB family endonuclease NucS
MRRPERTKLQVVTEDEIRDLLANQLEVLEPGLCLIEKEKYIPNPLGTRGFIDLLARDASGHFVLIELKRSDASAREAIHEILKYVEGVKYHLGAGITKFAS